MLSSVIALSVAKLSRLRVLRTITMFAFSRLAQLRVLQATCDDPDKRCHHRHDAEYNQVFHVLPHLLRGIETGSSGFG
jgi:hypothetical protein